MNTILQKRIEAATTFLFKQRGLDKESCRQAMYYILSNQWISVDEALPPIREKDIENRSWSDWVLIITHEGTAFMDCYAFHRKEWINNGNDVTHWAPIPSLEGGEE